jgi:hypothetical protein
MKICGLRVDIQEVLGPLCKVVGIKEFPDLIYNRKFRGPSPRCGGPAALSGIMVDHGRRGHWARRRLAGAWRAGARASRSSPVGRNRERGTRGTRWAAHRGAGSSVAAER